MATYVNVENISGIMLPDSSFYEGEIENNLFSDAGTLTWRNGASCKGEFNQGLMHGEGSFRNGFLHGHGTYKDANGWHYEGVFSHGNINGQGEMVYFKVMMYMKTNIDL